MSSFTNVFGGTTIYPSDVTYLALALTANTTLEWPLEAAAGSTTVARIIDITPTGVYSITMPPATETGTGQTILFNNLGPDAVTVKDSAGGTLISLSSGTVWQLYLTANATSAGTWRTFQYGAATASAQASALAGYGLVAQGSLLSQNAPTTAFSASYTLGTADRAGNFVWTGASGTLSLLASATATNGFFTFVRNGGTGQLTIDPAGSETINGASTLVLQPADSVIVVCSGATWYTIGYGQDAVFAFDYTAVSLTSVTTSYTLSGAELNRIAYSFTGLLTTNMAIIVPATTQQYWVANNTTGSFTFSVRTAAQVTGVTIAQGARSILYCDGTNVLNAATGGIATPLAVADGGTGSTTAGGALINLGGTATGIGVFNAASATAGRLALAAAPTASPTFTGTSTVAAEVINGASLTNASEFLAVTGNAKITGKLYSASVSVNGGGATTNGVWYTILASASIPTGITLCFCSNDQTGYDGSAILMKGASSKILLQDKLNVNGNTFQIDGSGNLQVQQTINNVALLTAYLTYTSAIN